MFYKLRWRLTLVNLVIIVALFAVLISGTYLFTSLESEKRSADFLQKISADIIINDYQDPPSPGSGFPSLPPPPGIFPPSGHLPPHIFFVKLSASGTVTFSSASSPLEAGQLTQLAGKILGLTRSEGSVDFAPNSYFYTLTPLATGEKLLVFEEATQRKSMLQVLVMALGIVGIICLILSYFSSHYWAGRAMIPVQDAWRQQQDFLADVSHELRTPLAVIQTNLDIVRHNDDESVADQRPWLDNIHEELKHMTKLVDSLLFLARADAHQLCSENTRFSLHTAMQQTVALFQPLAHSKDIEIDLFAEPTIYCGDEAKVKQILSILLENALKYTPPGSHITVQLHQLEHTVRFDVTDTGTGIAPEHLVKIFDRFYQVDTSRGQEGGGTGLGLAIAKCLTECLHGRLTAASTPGEGSTFSVYLPFKSTG